MSFKIEVRPFASAAIVQAYGWYEDQQPGTGEKFLQALADVYNKIRANPKTYSYTSQPIRQAKIYRFPYVILYENVSGGVVVYNVFMTKQNPKKKRKR